MSYLAPSTLSTERIGEDAIHSESQLQSPLARTASIHILDDDALLNIFYLYRPTIFDGDEDDGDLIEGGKRWDRENGGTNSGTFPKIAESHTWTCWHILLPFHSSLITTMKIRTSP